MTWLMRSTSRPRAATSVATRMSRSACLESRDRLFALFLRHVAVQCRRRITARLQAFGEFDGGDAGAYEHEHGVERFGFEQSGQRVEFVYAGDDPIALMDRLGGGRAQLDRDFRRIAQVLLRDTPDHRRHRRRKQRDLTLGRRLPENPLDVFDEAHPQHFVGFVEHDGLQRAEFQRAAAHVIHQAPRRADDDVHAAFQLPQLHRVILTAVDRQHVESLQMTRVRLKRFGDLDREFPRRRQYEHLRFGRASGRAATAAAARTRRFCRCRSAPGRRRRDPPTDVEWWGSGSASAFRSRRR